MKASRLRSVLVAVSGGLVAYGPEQNSVTERVAILGHNSVSWFATALGAQAIGGVMVQLDKTFPTNDCAM